MTFQGPSNSDFGLPQTLPDPPRREFGVLFGTNLLYKHMKHVSFLWVFMYLVQSLKYMALGLMVYKNERFASTKHSKSKFDAFKHILKNEVLSLVLQAHFCLGMSNQVMKVTGPPKDLLRVTLGLQEPSLLQHYSSIPPMGMPNLSEASVRLFPPIRRAFFQE